MKQVNHAQANYKCELDKVIPKLLENVLSQIEKKKVACQLTKEFDSEGNYLDQARKKNGSAIFYAFSKRVVLVEIFYDENGLPKTREVLVSKDEFLKWTKECLDRTEDVYSRLLAYEDKKPFESCFPTDDIL